MSSFRHNFYLVILICVLSGCLLGLRAGLIAERMRYMDISYPTWMASLELLDQTCGKDKVMILGDSWALQALDPRILGKNFVNISFGGGSPTELYFVMKNRWHCEEPPRRIILSVAPHHFRMDDGYWNEGIRNVVTLRDREQVRSLSRQLKDFQLYKEDAFSGDVIEKKIGEFLKEISFPSTQFAALRNALFEKRYKKNRQAYEFMTEQSRGYYTFGNDAYVDKPEENETLSSFAPSPVIDYYFDRLLELISKRGIEIEFINMPISDLTWAASHPEYVKGFEEYINAKMVQYHGRVVGGYFPVLPVNDFIDSGHLKEFSAKLWSQKEAPLLQ